MNNRTLALSVISAGAIGVGIWWFAKTESAPVTETPAKAATVAPSPKVAALVIAPPKAATPVVAPVAPAVVPSANPQPTVAAAKPTADAALKTAVDNLVQVLESQDVNAFVQDYMVPTLVDNMSGQALRSQLPADATPEVRAQVEQILQQRMPQMIQQLTEELTQRMAQDPKAAQGFQKLGAAIKQAAFNPPEMNATGDRATYTLETNGDKDVPPALIMVLRNGKWTLDFRSMFSAAQGQ